MLSRTCGVLLPTTNSANNLRALDGQGAPHVSVLSTRLSKCVSFISGGDALRPATYPLCPCSDAFDLQSFFALHDLNGDGILDSEEIEAIYGVHHLDSQKKSPDDAAHRAKAQRIIREVLEKMDKNKDGVLSPEEFIAAGFSGLPDFTSLGAEGHHYDEGPRYMRWSLADQLTYLLRCSQRVNFFYITKVTIIAFVCCIEEAEHSNRFERNVSQHSRDSNGRVVCASRRHVRFIANSF